MKYEYEDVKDNNLNSYLNNLENPDKPLNLKGAHIIGRELKDDKPQIPKGFLLSLIPDGRKHRIVKKMANLLSNGQPSSYLDLARCIKLRLTQANYQGNDRRDWNKQIRDRLRTLKKRWRQSGYKIKSINTPVEGYQLILR